MKCRNKKDFIASRIRYIFSLLTRFPRFSEQIIIVLTLDEVKKRFNEIMGTTPHQILCTATVWSCRKWIPIFLTNKNAFVKIIIFRIRVKKLGWVCSDDLRFRDQCIPEFSKKRNELKCYHSKLEKILNKKRVCKIWKIIIECRFCFVLCSHALKDHRLLR